MSFITDAQTGSNFSRRGMVFHGGVNDVMLMVAGDFLSFFFYLQRYMTILVVKHLLINL